MRSTAPPIIVTELCADGLLATAKSRRRLEPPRGRGQPRSDPRRDPGQNQPSQVAWIIRNERKCPPEIAASLGHLPGKEVVDPGGLVGGLSSARLAPDDIFLFSSQATCGDHFFIDAQQVVLLCAQIAG